MAVIPLSREDPEYWHGQLYPGDKPEWLVFCLTWVDDPCDDWSENVCKISSESPSKPLSGRVP